MGKLKCPSLDEWIKKMWCIYAMEFYSTIKINEILSFSTTWMDFEGIMPSEISQTEKDKYHMILLIWYEYKSIKTKQMNKQNKTKTNSQIQRTYEWLQEGRGIGRWAKAEEGQL